jgi:tellurite resistance protein TerC
LHYGLAAVLVFVGAKMLLAGFYKIPTLTSLLVIVGMLTVAVAASLLHAARQSKATKGAATAAANSSHATTQFRRQRT